MDMRLIEEYNSCRKAIVDSNFENFLSYKKLFKLVYDASNSLSASDFKSFCKSIDINPYQAKVYYNTYDRFFEESIVRYKISDELAIRAKNWDISMWMEFSKLYDSDETCRKVLFFSLVSKKLKYSSVSLPIEKLTLNDIKKYKNFINKHKRKKPTDVNRKFKSIKTRLNNFINKEFKSYVKADTTLLRDINEHNESLISIIEENMDYDVIGEKPEVVDIIEEKTIEVDPTPQNNEEYQDDILDSPMTEWDKVIHRYKLTEIYKLYASGQKMEVNWENPYYAVIFLGLDIFNMPSKEEYRRIYKELIMLFHPDNKSEVNKNTANLLLIILNDINLNIWGINGERYLKFINSIKFSLMNLGV